MTRTYATVELTRPHWSRTEKVTAAMPAWPQCCVSDVKSWVQVGMMGEHELGAAVVVQPEVNVALAIEAVSTEQSSVRFEAARVMTGARVSWIVTAAVWTTWLPQGSRTVKVTGSEPPQRDGSVPAT
jgi:hypothetical protein